MPEPQPNPEPTPKPIQMALDELQVQLENVKTENTDLKAQLETANKNLEKANSILEGQVRASLTQKAKALTNIPETSLAKMTIDELETTVTVAAQIKKPAKSIRFGMDTKEENSGINDMFSATWRKQ